MRSGATARSSGRFRSETMNGLQDLISTFVQSGQQFDSNIICSVAKLTHVDLGRYAKNNPGIKYDRVFWRDLRNANF